MKKNIMQMILLLRTIFDGNKLVPLITLTALVWFKIYLFELKQISNTYKHIQYKLGSERKPMADEFISLNHQSYKRDNYKMTACYKNMYIRGGFKKFEEKCCQICNCHGKFTLYVHVVN